MWLGGRGSREVASCCKFSVSQHHQPTLSFLCRPGSLRPMCLQIPSPTLVYCTLFPCLVLLRSRDQEAAERVQSPRTLESDYSIYQLSCLHLNNLPGPGFLICNWRTVPLPPCIYIHVNTKPRGQTVQDEFVCPFPSPLLGYTGHHL